MSSVVAGFVGPPGWRDPSPDEFRSVSGIEAVGMTLDLGPFDWSLDRIATTEGQIAQAAAALVDRGATVVGIVGTPFGWAGLGPGERPHDRNERIAASCGTPVVSAVSGVLDWLADLGARRVALAATYYDRDWCERWERFVAHQGFDVANCSSMADLGIVSSPLVATDETHWAPLPDRIEATVTGVLRLGAADAVVVSGAGARTLTCHDRLVAAAGVPVVSSDLGPVPGARADDGAGSRVPASWWPTSEVGS